MPPRHPELTEFIQRHVLRLGDFTLSSGARSSYYIDCRIVSHHPRGMKLVCDALAAELTPQPVEAVGGLELGATPLVGGYLLHSQCHGRPVRGFTVRKAAKIHGTRQRVEGPALQPGTRVAILEDVVTTGGSILEAVDAVAALDCPIVMALAIVDREQGAADKLAQRHIPYQPLVRLADLDLSG